MGLLPPFSRKLRVGNHVGLIKFSLFCHAGGGREADTDGSFLESDGVDLMMEEEWYARVHHIAR